MSEEISKKVALGDFEEIMRLAAEIAGRSSSSPRPSKAKGAPDPILPAFVPTPEDYAKCWDEVRGLEEPKRLLQEALIQPILYAHIYAHYGKKPTKGVLLYGPPGCGKTMLGKAAAKACALGLDSEAQKDAFQYVSGSSLMDKYVGGTEEKIRELFENAKKFHKKTGRRCTLFVDEADSLLVPRGSGTWYLDSFVNQFLTEMDGFDSKGCFVILATNRHNSLDPAVVREGRIDYKIKVDRPDLGLATDILQHNLSATPLAGLAPAELASTIANEAFHPRYLIKKIKTDEGPLRFTFAHTINGAVLVQVVEHAKTLAMRRDMASGTLGGITLEDLQVSVKHCYEQTLAVNQDVNLHSFLEANGVEV